MIKKKKNEIVDVCIPLCPDNVIISDDGEIFYFIDEIDNDEYDSDIGNETVREMRLQNGED